MNVYDCANELAKAMRESQEYKKLKEAKAALEQDPKGKEMAEEFLKIEPGNRISEISGTRKFRKKKMKNYKSLLAILGLNTVAMEYLHAFMRFK